MAILIIIFVLFIIMIFRIKSKKNHIVWILNILKYFLPIFCVTFFGQAFLLIISLYECRNGKTYYDKNYSCRNKTVFYVLYSIAVIPLMIQIFFGFVTSTMYYIPDYIIINNNNSVLLKRNTLSDISFFLCKIIIIVIFVFDEQIEYEHSGIICFLSILTGLNAYCNLFLQNYRNIIIKRFNDLLSLTLFWSFFILLIKIIFKNIGFTGELYLYIFGQILIILYYSFYLNLSTDFLNINFNNINSNIECLNYIRQYLKIINEKDLSRDSLLIFNSYIEKIEHNCTDKSCLLKKYLKSLSKGITSNFLLLQYTEKLFKIAKSKFPKEAILRINYVIFLFTQTYKTKQAKIELELIKSYSYADNLNIYICKKYIEDIQFLKFENNKDKLEIINKNQNLEYKNNLQYFKELIIKSSYLYYDFWLSLYNYHKQGVENFSKLNDIGNELNKIIKIIDNIFKKLNEFKNNNYEIIKLYESFVKDVLNNNEKYKKYRNLYDNLIFDKKIKNKQEIDFTNCDLKLLNKEENNYLIISMDEKSKGIIKNASLGTCQIFGYQKEEIIGKNINILIPEIFQKDHNKLINDLFDKNVNIFYDCLINKLTYKPEYFELNVHARNKSKYLIPLHFLIYLVKTEESELIYIVEVNRNNSYIGELNNDFKDKEQKNENICCVLTDINFKIQTFSSNSLELLKLNSNIINSSVEITSFIKQLNSDFILNSSFANKENLDYEEAEITTYDIINKDKIKKFDSNKSSNRYDFIDKIELKRLKLTKKLINTKYSYPNKITWIIDSNIKSSVTYKKKSKNKKSSLYSTDINNNSTSINFNNSIYENNFLMKVREVNISNKHKGYYFYFKKLKNIYRTKTNNIKNVKSFFKSTSKVNKNYFNFNKNQNQIDDDSKINNDISRKSSLYLRGEKKIEGKNVNFGFQKINLKRSKSGRENYKEEILENQFNIKSNYIPNSTFNFIIDINDMLYKPCYKIISISDIIENLKKQAIDKITISTKNNTNKNSQEIISDSSYSQEYYSNSEYSNSNMNSSERYSSKISDSKKIS